MVLLQTLTLTVTIQIQFMNGLSSENLGWPVYLITNENERAFFFSVFRQNESTLDMICQDQKMADVWTEGLVESFDL